MSDVAVDLKKFRGEVKTWLQANFPQQLKNQPPAVVMGRAGQGSLREAASQWRQRLATQGWGAPTWPRQYGGADLSHKQAALISEQMSTMGIFNPIPFLAGMGITMVGPTLLEYGTDEQKQRHLPPMASGEYFWCLGYSEPGAGSDLASLATKAQDRGDHWLINGQKTWTSGADIAQWCGALVRTEANTNKRDGISLVMFPMDQPGVETRPIQLISGDSPFCEMFFNNARADKSELLGKLNDGWSVGKRLLQHERQSQTGTAAASPAGERKSLPALALDYVGANTQGELDDADLRARLCNHLMDAQAHQLTLSRIAAEAKGSVEVTAVASILKNSATSVAQTRAELTLELMGYQGIGWEGEQYREEELSLVRSWLSGKAMSIYGGSAEIQKNIICKNILGLPETTQKG